MKSTIHVHKKKDKIKNTMLNSLFIGLSSFMSSFKGEKILTVNKYILSSSFVQNHK